MLYVVCCIGVLAAGCGLGGGFLLTEAVKASESPNNIRRINAHHFPIRKTVL